jgi:N4-gp56 family major capsid protein
MAYTAYGDISPRTAAYAEKELLKRAIPFMVLEKFGQSKPLPANNSKTIVFRRYNALPNAPTALAEGVTPGSLTLSTTDIPCTLTQYGSMVTITDIIMDTHEDAVLNESIELLGEQAAQMIETMRFGILKGGTNVVYANGATRNAVNSVITLAVQRKSTKALKRQNAEQITKVTRSTPAYGTEPVAKSFIGLIHPDCEADSRPAPRRRDVETVRHRTARRPDHPSGQPVAGQVRHGQVCRRHQGVCDRAHHRCKDVVAEFVQTEDDQRHPQV